MQARHWEYTRRGFVGTTLAGLAAWGGSRLAAEEPEARAPFRNPFVYRFRIGELEAFSISDCNLTLREGLDLMWPEEQRPLMKDAMARHGERLDGIPLYVNILAVRKGGEVALFDSGFGQGGNPQMGWLMDGLAAAGIEPQDVTLGFLSHAHTDHLNGFVYQGKPAFPNATVHLLPEELSFWREPDPDFSKSKRDKRPLPGMVREICSHYETLGEKLQVVQDGAEFWEGRIRVEAAPGHTDGHACFRIRSAGEELLHLTDLAHHHLLMFADVNWTIAFDHDPETAVVTRKRYWREAAANHTRCYGFHLPWPGLGRIVEESPTTYHWWAERMMWE